MGPGPFWSKFCVLVQKAVFIQKYQLLKLILVRFGLFVKVFLVFFCRIFVNSSGDVSSIEQPLMEFSRGGFTVNFLLRSGPGKFGSRGSRPNVTKNGVVLIERWNDVL